MAQNKWLLLCLCICICLQLRKSKQIISNQIMGMPLRSLLLKYNQRILIILTDWGRWARKYKTTFWRWQWERGNSVKCTKLTTKRRAKSLLSKWFKFKSSDPVPNSNNSPSTKSTRSPKSKTPLTSSASLKFSKLPTTITLCMSFAMRALSSKK